ncbi:MAG: uracil-DNA glycosylase [Chlamydiae bacterium]|nr:uracil-DNA glycosylase [Chlamydiota bacterium]
MNVKLNPTWLQQLRSEIESDYFKQLLIYIDNEKKQGCTVYPPEDLVFEAFNRTPFNKVRVVILGQDPYHGKNQAHGLAFSVCRTEKIPPSLKNIYKEMISDLNIEKPEHGCLESWADQGVLLLNSTLTVREKEPKSHHNRGWERFTDAVLQKLIEEKDFLIFVFWGKSAQDKLKNLRMKQGAHHYILIAAHPSPYSAVNFLGCKHFSKINQILINEKQKPIDWIIK